MLGNNTKTAINFSFSLLTQAILREHALVSPTNCMEFVGDILVGKHCFEDSILLVAELASG